MTILENRAILQVNEPPSTTSKINIFSVKVEDEDDIDET
jgi:hypothetical protein